MSWGLFLAICYQKSARVHWILSFMSLSQMLRIYLSMVSQNTSRGHDDGKREEVLKLLTKC